MSSLLSSSSLSMIYTNTINSRNEPSTEQENSQTSINRETNLSSNKMNPTSGCLDNMSKSLSSSSKSLSSSSSSLSLQSSSSISKSLRSKSIHTEQQQSQQVQQQQTSDFSMDYFFNIINCSLCKKKLNQPKLLNCLHAFCKSCLLAYSMTNESAMNDQHMGTQSLIIGCPKCKQETMVYTYLFFHF